MQGPDLDAYAKQWRLFADIFNNVGKAILLLHRTIFPEMYQILHMQFMHVQGALDLVGYAHSSRVDPRVPAGAGVTSIPEPLPAAGLPG